MALMISIGVIALLLVIVNCYIALDVLEARVQALEIQVEKMSDWRISGDLVDWQRFPGKRFE